MSNTQVVRATPAHVCDLAERLRAADLQEIKASSGVTPGDALALSFLTSKSKWALIHEGRCEAIFGVAAWPMCPDIGAPWLLASEEFPKLRRFIVKHTDEFNSECERAFPLLANYVDARHTTSILWLLWGGYTLDSIDLHHGVERRPFFRFSKVSRHV